MLKDNYLITSILSKSRSNKRNKQQVISQIKRALILLSCCSLHIHASPWLEADDPFLRSDLLYLSDSGVLAAPINHFPLRWSFIGEDVTGIAKSPDLSASIMLAGRHVHHALDNARYSRGKREFRAFYAGDTISTQGYGEFSDEHWGAYASYEQLEKDFSFRFTSGYSQNNKNRKFRWDGSYLSLNSGSILVTAGSLKRWWGQGWQHNLNLGSYTAPIPELSISYLGENRVLGNWSSEVIMGSPSKGTHDYHVAGRVIAKPVTLVELGTTYHSWLGSDDQKTESQLILDGKLTLPNFNSFHHSAYGEIASTNEHSVLGAWFIGWSGQFNVSENTIRLVLERQGSGSNKSPDNWQQARYPNYSDSQARNTYMLDNSYSFAAYLQMSNDHKLSAIYKKSHAENMDFKTMEIIQFAYRLPAFAGMLHFGAVASDSNLTSELTTWTGYEYRF